MGNNNHSNSQNNGGGLGKSGNRQSVHNALMSREGSNVSSQGVPPQTVFNQSTVVPTLSQASLKSDTSQQQGNIDPRRNTPQPLVNGEDMSEDEIGQLIKDHKELRMSNSYSSFPHKNIEPLTSLFPQVRSTPKLRSIISKKKIKSNNFKTVSLLNDYRNHAPRLTTANIPPDSIDWMD